MTDAEQFERLIAAIEANTNAQTRLVQELAGKRARKGETRAQRQRRLTLDKPITVTPIVAASVDRALARVGRR